MSRTKTTSARVKGPLGDFVATNLGEAAAFEHLTAELQHAFAQPDVSFQVLDAETVIQRGRERRAS